MRKMWSYIILLIVAIQVQSGELYVSPNGDDANSGTITAPLKSLVKARDILRSRRGKIGKKQATVYLRGGTYYLVKPFLLEPQDSYTTYKSYKAEIPILNGACIIKYWRQLKDEPVGVTKKAKGKLWVANTKKGWKFCFLYVNGKRMQRARLINNNQWRKWPKDHRVGPPEKQGQLVTLSKNKSALEHLSSNGDVEMVCIMAQYGVMGNGVLTDINAKTGTMRWNSKQINLRKSRNPHERGYNLENALSLIDEPGEWAVDSTAGKLYYWPKENEDMRKAKVLAPKAYELVRLQGYDSAKLARTSPGPVVRNVEFDGITMKYTDRLPEDCWPNNWLFRQWENVDAMVYVQGAEDCTFKNCRMLYSGSYGVTLNHHSQRITLEANEIGWTGSGGVFLEGYGPGKTDVCRNNVVVRNYIHDHGLANYWHSPSIQIYQSGHNRITYNLMQYSAYNAVSIVGMHPKYMNQVAKMIPGTWEGQWHVQGYFRPLIHDFPSDVVKKIKSGKQRFDRETIKPYMHSNSNLIERNVIVEPHSILNEGGALYAWSSGKGNKWSENVIFVSHAMPGSSILALDDLAEYFTVEGNVFWVNGHILNGVGARGGERGNVIKNNHRVMFKPEHRARIKTGFGKWWVNHAGRKKMDDLCAIIFVKVKKKGGWLGNPDIGIPGIDKNTILKNAPEVVLPKGSNVTIEE